MLKKYTKPYPTIGSIIAGKEYDYVSYRGYDEKRNIPPATGNNTDGKFCGCFEVVNGKIIPLDGDFYDKEEAVIASEEWTMPDNGIEKGLTVIVEMEFVPAGEMQKYIESYRRETHAREEKKTMYRAVDIKWDTDGDEELLTALPKEMDIPNSIDDPDCISNWLSDETGYCHYGFRLVDQDGNDVHFI